VIRDNILIFGWATGFQNSKEDTSRKNWASTLVKESFLVALDWECSNIVVGETVVARR
jgi:hypothetical protein